MPGRRLSRRPRASRRPRLTPRGPRTAARAAAGPASVHEFPNPPREHPPLGVVMDQGQGIPVGVAGLVGSTETTQQLAARRVEVAIVLEGELVDEAETGL